MDLLLQCAKNFENLLTCKYHFIIGRKGVQREFFITFQKKDFHHIAGLHKLTDKRSLQHGSREELFDEIIQGKFDINFLKSSFHFEEMSDRLEALVNLEKLLDSENLVFKYNENVRASSSIKAAYLLEGTLNGQTLFLFLDCRSDSMPKEQVCRSFFPKSRIDYSIGQPRYTLLKKEKLRPN
ncbi:MAG: hypothetical protein K6B43_09870 [Treponema sp.]|nr:hypothetical protein [Treponema sp.]